MHCRFLNKTISQLVVAMFIFSLTSCGTSNPPSSKPSDAVQSILDSANSLLNDGYLAKSKTYLDSSFLKLNFPRKIDGWQKYNFFANYYLNYDIQLDKAMKHVDSMRLMLNGNEDKYRELHALTTFVRADVLVAQKRYNEAFQDYYKGRAFAKQYLNNCSYSDFNYHLGIVRYRQRQYAKAIPYFKQAVAKRNDCDQNFSNMVAKPQSFFNAIGLSYEKINKLDSAVVYYKKGLEFLTDQAPKFVDDSAFFERAKGVMLGNLGGVYCQLLQFDLAEKNLKKSIRINDRSGFEVVDAVTAQLKLAELFIQTRRFKEAYTYLHMIKQRIDWHKMQNRDVEQLLLRWYKVKWEYAEKAESVTHAYAAARTYFNIKDSLVTANQNMMPFDMDNAFKIKDQQHNIDLLGRDNQIKKISLITVAMLTGLVFIIALVIWRNLKKTKENVSSLTKLNARINEQNIQMQKVLADLEQSQAENTRLMRIVAHDLRNPIEGVNAILQLMQHPNRTDEDKEMLNIMDAACRNALTLVGDLLNVQLDRNHIKKEEIDLSQLLKHCVNLLKHKAAEKQQVIHLDVLEIKIWAYREKLWRVLSNLITNAIKFSQEGAVIEIAVKRESDRLQIMVKDNGIGIPVTMKDQIFNMFADNKRVGTHGEKSYGLGLIIAKQIIALHGGKLWFDSEEGNGSTFYVELPLH